MKKIVVFTHDNLGMVGCVLNLELSFPDVHKQYFFTNYHNISEKTQEILEYSRENEIKYLVISGISFADNKEHLRDLKSLPILLVDHHIYPDGFWDEFPEITSLLDTSKSPGLLLNENLKNKGKNVRLDKITELIDVYDTWKDDHPAFDISQDLNDYFWRVGQSKFLQELIRRDLRLPEDFSEVSRDIREEAEKEIESLESSGKIVRSGRTSVILQNNKWFSRAMIREMRSGQELVIGAGNSGIMKVRISKSSGYSEDQLRVIGKEITGSDCCHSHAFSYMSGRSIMDEVKRILKIISDNT